MAGESTYDEERDEGLEEDLDEGRPTERYGTSQPGMREVIDDDEDVDLDEDLDEEDSALGLGERP